MHPVAQQVHGDLGVYVMGDRYDCRVNLTDILLVVFAYVFDPEFFGEYPGTLQVSIHQEHRFQPDLGQGRQMHTFGGCAAAYDSEAGFILCQILSF